jgi:histidinol phosphatase-like enzyme
MNKKLMIICFDLDGVLCKTNGNNYETSIPIKNNIKFINQLYKQRFVIKIFTSRFMGRSNENVSLAKNKGLLLTKNQLKKWGVKYHHLIMGKPSYDLFVDDKAYGFDRSWAMKLKKYLN